MFNDPIFNLLLVIAVPLMIVVWLVHREEQKYFERRDAECKARRQRIIDSFRKR